MARIHLASMTTPRPWKEAEFRDLLALPQSVAATHRHGFALGRVILDEAELLTVAVAPEARREGIGRACLDTFHDMALARGADTAFLEVAETNHAARALYDAAGYSVAGRRRGYYAGDPPVDAIVLHGRLADLVRGHRAG